MARKARRRARQNSGRSARKIGQVLGDVLLEQQRQCRRVDVERRRDERAASGRPSEPAVAQEPREAEAIDDGAIAADERTALFLEAKSLHLDVDDERSLSRLRGLAPDDAARVGRGELRHGLAVALGDFHDPADLPHTTRRTCRRARPVDGREVTPDPPLRVVPLHRVGDHATHHIRLPAPTRTAPFCNALADPERPRRHLRPDGALAPRLNVEALLSRDPAELVEERAG
jgi:hypothetical protein